MAKVFEVTPNSYSINGGTPVISKTPIETCWNIAEPGDYVYLQAGIYKRITLKPSKRPKLSAPVTIIGQDDLSSVIARDEIVGSTDAIILKSGLRDLILQNLYVEIDDRAGIKTEGPNGATNVFIKDCIFSGKGSAYNFNWKDTSKWGGHHYYTKSWKESGVTYKSCYLEHGIYLHGIQGNHIFDNMQFIHCGRSAIQVVNRQSENGTPQPIGIGNIVVSNCYVEDCGINDGASALTFRGGMPSSNITIDDVIIRYGCNPALDSKFQKNIAGLLVVDSGGDSDPNDTFDDSAWPGGCKSLTIRDCDWEIGTLYPGTGSFLRDSAIISHVKECIIESGRFVTAKSRNRETFRIGGTCESFKIARSVYIDGRIRYKADPIYQTFDLFKEAHPELIL